MYEGENKLVQLDKAISHALTSTELTENQVEIDVLRLDQIHPVISGNKWFKLKYYLREAIDNHHQTILSFGGAYSNHIVATAYAAAEYGLSSVGIIRGDEERALSHTLKAAADYGMQLHFISRADYRLKETDNFLQHIRKQFGNVYVIPEGGAGPRGVKGSEEILALTDYPTYTHIICAVGTGTMFAGLAHSISPAQELIGIPVLKGFNRHVGKLPACFPEASGKFNCRLFYDYHFGGYGKSAESLLTFMNDFYRQSAIPSDFVYTGKMFFALMQLVRQGYFRKETKVLAIHSGGLQGNLSLPKGKLLF